VCLYAERAPREELLHGAYAFLAGFLIRLLPEFISLKYPVGYDTPLYAYQIQHIVDRPLPILFRSTFLFRVLMWAVLRATGLDVLLLLKIAGPLVYGLLAVSFYTFLRSAVGWDGRLSLLCTAICVLQVPTLRLSWDLFRNELGLAMFFLFASATVTGRARVRWPLVALLAFLTTLSHELASITMFTWSFYPDKYFC